MQLQVCSSRVEPAQLELPAHYPFRERQKSQEEM